MEFFGFEVGYDDDVVVEKFFGFVIFFKFGYELFDFVFKVNFDNVEFVCVWVVIDFYYFFNF